MANHTYKRQTMVKILMSSKKSTQKPMSNYEKRMIVRNPFASAKDYNKLSSEEKDEWKRNWVK